MMTSIKRNELNLQKKIQLAEKDNICKTQVASILKRKPLNTWLLLRKIGKGTERGIAIQTNVIL